MKKIFYLMRHGETLFNKRRKIQGWCDSPLTELGIRQAKSVGKYFKENHIEFDHLYSSTLDRCCDTLEIATSRKDYVRLKDLREMNFGTYEGESEDLNPPREMFDTYFLAFGGESREQVRSRMCRVCQEIMEKDDHHQVLAVSHSGACFHFMRSYVDEETLQYQRKLGFSNCCLFKYEYEDGHFRLLDVIRTKLIEEE